MSATHKHVHIGTGRFGLGFVGYFAHALKGEIAFFNRPSDGEDSKVRNRSLQESSSYLISYPSFASKAADEIPFGSFTLLEPAFKELIDVIADPATRLVTTAVGEAQLRYLAPLIAAGLSERSSKADGLIIMACENGYRSSSKLKASVRKTFAEVDAHGFLDCIVDQICFNFDSFMAPVTVGVEDHREWIIEDADGIGEGLFEHPQITVISPEAKARTGEAFDLYIKRKQWLLNGFHLCLAILGYSRMGPDTLIRDVIMSERDRTAGIRKELVNALRLTDADNLCFSETAIVQYIETVERRFQATEDTCSRILKDFLFGKDRIELIRRDLGRRLGNNDRLSDIVRDELYDNVFTFFDKVHNRVFEPLKVLTDKNSGGTELGLTLVNVFPFVRNQMEVLRDQGTGGER